jgi:hypothetical protein
LTDNWGAWWQVSFHNPKQVRKCKAEKRINEIVNRLNKTKQEAYPDLAARRETFDQVMRMFVSILCFPQHVPLARRNSV